MSGKKGRTGGQNAIPVKWKGKQFDSFADLDNHLGLSPGYSNSYYRSSRDLLGHEIKVLSNNKKRKRTDKEMIEFYSFVNARKAQLKTKSLDEMVSEFDRR